jgi:hypothetical protein
MTWKNYDQLRVRLLDILTGDILPLPSWNDLERHEQQIAIAVSGANGITPEYWAKLDNSSREPWLEKTIHLLTNQQRNAGPEDPPRVVLRGLGERPIVGGVEKSPLTRAQHDVVKTLLDAGERGLSKDELECESKHGDARKILKRLAESDPGWKAVIHFAGRTGGGYRIR